MVDLAGPPPVEARRGRDRLQGLVGLFIYSNSIVKFDLRLDGSRLGQLHAFGYVLFKVDPWPECMAGISVWDRLGICLVQTLRFLRCMYVLSDANPSKSIVSRISWELSASNSNINRYRQISTKQHLRLWALAIQALNQVINRTVLQIWHLPNQIIL